MFILEVINLSKEFLVKNNKKTQSKSGLSKFIDSLLIRNQKSFKEKKILALRDINFGIEQGQSIGIIGLNGAGKSTLLQVIAGTLKATRGKVILKGRVAALLELGAGFNPEFTGRENVYLNASLFGLEKREIDQRFSNIEDFAEIGEFINEPVKTYSSGMYVRLAFAIVANLEPTLLIIDEALSVGDAKFQLKCFNFLRKFKETGGSLIMVSHDLNSIARLSEKVLLLDKGSVLRLGKPIDVINHYSKLISDHSNNKYKHNTVITHEDYQEMDYGNYDALISNPRLFNSKNINSKILNTGEDFKISYKANIKKNINVPVFSIRIRNVKGVEIYGTNTLFAKINTPKILRVGQNFDVAFCLKGNLSPGVYLISLGISSAENNSLNVIHRKRECIEFEVISEDGSFGIANCFGSIRISEIPTSRLKQNNITSK
jgi:ABC-type polysaccharide/polyol phosphate transport system ATPase subunit